MINITLQKTCTRATWDILYDLTLHKKDSKYFMTSANWSALNPTLMGEVITECKRRRTVTKACIRLVKQVILSRVISCLY